MNFPEELREKIEMFFGNNKELRDKLLAGDPDSIRQIGSISQRGINPKDIVEAYESNDSVAMGRLYSKAKRMFELQKLYKELCLEYSKVTREKLYMDR